MIIINHLSMTYGTRLLFNDVNLVLAEHNRYGLVGANGTGKSTFLRLLTAQETPTDGSIAISKNAKIGWLKQDQFLYEHELVLNVVLRGNAQLWSALQERIAIYKEPITEQSGYRLADLEEIIAHHDGYNVETVAEQLLSGLGIKSADQYEPLSSLSGGFKLRVLLAQALFNNPDILLLDEPNNYLDIVTIRWLEDYLKNNFKGILIFTSHDQDFLNNLSTTILDIDYGEIREYKGNYDAFLKQKNLVIEQKLKERVYLEKKVAAMQAFVDRFKASTRSKQAMSRAKALEKIELPDIEKSSRRAPHLAFPIKRHSGKIVLTVQKISKGFNNNNVLKNISFTINKGDKVAIIGANGIGKSTLLKIITNHLPADSGTFSWGFETHVSYFAQEHYEMKRDDSTVFDWLSEHTTDIPTPVLRQTLGTVLFSQDDINKTVSVLSGGEITRLLFAKMMLDRNNVLILDEPTNHLDIESRAALAHALQKYEGTVILVSHDRHFVTQVANRIIALSAKGIFDFKGSYAEYVLHGFDHLSKKL